MRVDGAEPTAGAVVLPIACFSSRAREEGCVQEPWTRVRGRGGRSQGWGPERGSRCQGRAGRGDWLANGGASPSPGRGYRGPGEAEPGTLNLLGTGRPHGTGANFSPPRRGVDRTGPFLVVTATVSLKSARPLPCVRCPGLTSRFLSQPPTEASLSHGTSHLGRMTVPALEVFQRLPCQPGDHHRPPGLRLTPAVSSVTPPPERTPEQDAQRVGTPIPTGVGTGATFGEQHARFLLKAWPAACRVQETLPSNAKG